MSVNMSVNTIETDECERECQYHRKRHRLTTLSVNVSQNDPEKRQGSMKTRVHGLRKRLTQAMPLFVQVLMHLSPSI